MNKLLLIILIGLGIITGCTNNSRQVENSNGNNTHSEASPTTFKKGVFVDLSDYEKDKRYSEVLELLKTNLGAFVQKDSKSFRSTFVTDSVADSMVLLIQDDTQYRFYDKIAIQEVSPSKINVTINYTNDKVTYEKIFIYNLVKNKEDKWKILFID
ncbi:hypothetical protein SAMN05444162_2161 [Paenibacillaceae bacterium GAS479]|nr:hypothetical protein SAMN05444162_2161 [Paenibacillaceae bacterium GAS479]